MPKISDEKRALRRLQILEAAWRCFQSQGLHATTMDDIIKSSKLSAGAVYSYFPSKEELILAAVTTSLGGLRERLEPILAARPPPPPAAFVEQAAEAVVHFTARQTYDLRRLALLGWSEAQRNERLRETMRDFYSGFRDRLADAAGSWKQDGLLRPDASPSDVAKALLAAMLGFVAQSALIGDVDPKDLARGVGDLIRARSDDAP